jgi:Flp pilus assembly pilin Flp
MMWAYRGGVMPHARNERGASAVEYALLLAGIVVFIVAWVGPLGDAFDNALNPACQYIAQTDCEMGG